MNEPRIQRCAVYTRKSTEEGLEQEFNSIDAQREAGEAYIKSQAHEGWRLIDKAYNDGGFTGGNMERPGLQELLKDIKAKKIDIVVIYKIDRLTRSLADFSRLIDVFDKYGVSFVSVTQQFSTSTSMGRLTLNVLLSFAQFEREMTSERIKDKILAAKRKGMFTGGCPPVGYKVVDHKLMIDETTAGIPRLIFNKYLELKNTMAVRRYLLETGVRTPPRNGRHGQALGRACYSHGHVMRILRNRVYNGEIFHKGIAYPGQHAAIIEPKIWDDVQLQLEANSRRHSMAKTKNICLLAGLIWDDQKNRMSPTYTKKKDAKGRPVRWWYYVSAPLVRSSKETKASLTRISQGEADRFVRRAVADHLRGRGEQAEAKILEKCDVLTARDVLDKYVEKVVLASNRVELHFLPILTKEGKLDVLDPVPTQIIKIDLRRPRGSVCFYHNDNATFKPPMRDTVLIKAVSLAWDWQRRLDANPKNTVAQLARDDGYSDSYLRHLLPLAKLSPRIMEAILDGACPHDFYLKSILDRPIPEDPQAQWKFYGFHRKLTHTVEQAMNINSAMAKSAKLGRSRRTRKAVQETTG